MSGWGQILMRLVKMVLGSGSLLWLGTFEKRRLWELGDDVE